jgi:hypothetical protein
LQLNAVIVNEDKVLYTFLFPKLPIPIKRIKERKV